MATSEALVPQGMEHGERVELEAAMTAGGVPKTVPAGGGSPSSPSQATLTGRSPDLSRWDVFEGREPSNVAPAAMRQDPFTLLEAKLAATENTALKYYFGRYKEFLE